MLSSDRHEATIAAIATPPGAGGIGVIRLSGPKSRAVLEGMFRPRHPADPLVSHRLYYGVIVDPATGVLLDEALAVYMRAPHTYTREEVVEFHCHGSSLVLGEVLARILLFPDIRLADPGEFTKRAFLNGRIDLTRAEAVAELLAAKTEKGARLALASLRGGLHDEIEKIRTNLVALRAIMEVAIDFPEEDVEILDAATLLTRLAEGVSTPLARILDRAEGGRIVRDGVAVVILGRPNVGKSSLLNRLLREDRAIVTDIPGTTRDVIEEYLDIRGVPVRIVDTAGIREGAGLVEGLGIERARRKLEEADLVLLVVDGEEGLLDEDRDLTALVGPKRMVVVVNKLDRMASPSVAPFVEVFPNRRVVAVSARDGIGIEALEEAVHAEVTGGEELPEPDHAVPNVRQVAALRRGMAAVARVEEGLRLGVSPDLVAIDLRDALDQLGDIVGETTTEDVLDMIFAEFCIGK
ncbi:MAG: tRNA uridine-5-carboxymethylaminomethyl(34) synthesis GTPase MnmE [Thermodesulfobacteriota bacterium]